MILYFNPRSLHGERPRRGSACQVRSCISIHAPCTGSDGFIPKRQAGSAISIHAPCTGSDMPLLHSSCRESAFQSTLPARGATWQRLCADHQAAISIHAPCTGSDADCPNLWIRVKKFQSTLPARGATKYASARRKLLSFQSTLPARGATVGCSCAIASAPYFNPRSLHGERRYTMLTG